MLLLVFTINSIFSQTIITDRSDQTESSSTVKRGSLQIETGIIVGFIEDDFNSEKQLLTPKRYLDTVFVAVLKLYCKNLLA